MAERRVNGKLSFLLTEGTSSGLSVLQKIVESPAARTAVSVVSSALSAVFAGTFVFDLVESGEILWGNFYYSYSFYILVLIAIFIYTYNRALFKFEKNIDSYRDSEYCMAYVRSKAIPEVADRYRRLIAENKTGELEQAMEEVQRLLK